MTTARWSLLIGTAVACMSVWSVLIFSLLPDKGNETAEIVGEGQDVPGDEPGNIESGDSLFFSELDTGNFEDPGLKDTAGRETEERTGEPSLTDEPIAESRQFAVRGIHPGDFDDIAPDKVISVDDLIERISKESD
ncbi:hypothetical protein MM300_03460 [Evansella sp. LMS18]|uniref:hypothetical protein n=1 Tax=Evansella sp. LMS18 TaxID=2924033 RepID=UPI0020D1CDF7|nr:hypothetical protein [Evansella sp. LMS18]UTR11400.1 hypothetical protein MM300_03460 [Evansella sp. LMS18]